MSADTNGLLSASVGYLKISEADIDLPQANGKGTFPAAYDPT
jgi:hypothetical protein